MSTFLFPPTHSLWLLTSFPSPVGAAAASQPLDKACGPPPPPQPRRSTRPAASMEHLWCYHFCLLGALPGQANVPSHLLGLGPHSHCQAATYGLSLWLWMTPEPPARLPSEPPPGAGDHEGRVPAQSPLLPALPLCSTSSWGTHSTRWRPARGWHPARGWWAWLCGREADSVVPPPGPALPELRKASCHVSAGTGQQGQERPHLTPGKMCRFLTAVTLQHKLTLPEASLKYVSWGRLLLEAPVGNPRLPIPASAGARPWLGPLLHPPGRQVGVLSTLPFLDLSLPLLFLVCTSRGPLSPRWPGGITSSKGQPISNLTDLRRGAYRIHSCREVDLDVFGVIVVPPQGCRKDLAWGLVLRNPSVQHSQSFAGSPS